MDAGENQQALQNIIDFIRLVSIILLVLHVYFFCYNAFDQWKLVSKISDRIIYSVARTGLFDNVHQSKLVALGFLAISLVCAKGKKDEKISLSLIVTPCAF